MAPKETVFITGANGQDARLLVESLSNQDILFICTSKNTAKSKSLYAGVKASILHEYLDITDTDSFAGLVQKYRPNRVFNFAGLSSVANSFSEPHDYQEINGFSVERILVKLHTKNLLGQIKFYQASSSEIFDPFETSIRSEVSTKKPQSPYGASKLYAFEVCQDFRIKKGYFVCSGILFGHESEYRSQEFLFGKVMNSFARIKIGLQKNITIGRLDTKRDWGYARDYVTAMNLMTTCATPEDYVVSTGELHSVREVIDVAYHACGISTALSEILVISDDLLREKDYHNLYGTSAKINRALGWETHLSFEKMVQRIQSIVLKNHLEIGTIVE